MNLGRLVVYTARGARGFGLGPALAVGALFLGVAFVAGRKSGKKRRKRNR